MRWLATEKLAFREKTKLGKISAESTVAEDKTQQPLNAGTGSGQNSSETALSPLPIQERKIK
jgi:hypothetical protein